MTYSIVTIIKRLTFLVNKFNRFVFDMIIPLKLLASDIHVREILYINYSIWSVFHYNLS